MHCRDRQSRRKKRTAVLGSVGHPGAARLAGDNRGVAGQKRQGLVATENELGRRRSGRSRRGCRSASGRSRGSAFLCRSAAAAAIATAVAATAMTTVATVATVAAMAAVAAVAAIPPMAAIPAVAAVMAVAAIAGAATPTAVKQQAGSCLPLAPQKGHPNQREEDCNSKQHDAVHPRILQKLTGCRKQGMLSLPSDFETSLRDGRFERGET